MKTRDYWSTPWELIDFIQDFAGYRFAVDACAEEWNRVAATWLDADHVYHREHGGMTYNRDGAIWCNPPFSRLGSFVDECLLFRAASVVFLGPNDCSTLWFQKLAKRANRILFLRPRVQFIPPPGVKPSSNSGSNVVFFIENLQTRRGIKSGCYLGDWKTRDVTHLGFGGSKCYGGGVK